MRRQQPSAAVAPIPEPRTNRINAVYGGAVHCIRMVSTTASTIHRRYLSG